MINVYRGVQIHFGTKSTTSDTFKGIVTTRTYDRNANTFMVEDGDGNPVNETFFGQFESAKISYVLTGSANGSGSLVVNTTDIANPGDLIVIGDPIFKPISGSYWIVQSPVGCENTNTTAIVVTCECKKFPNITA